MFGESDLASRNRKTADASLQKKYPVFVRAYDLLMEGAQDLRPLPFAGKLSRSPGVPRIPVWPTGRDDPPSPRPPTGVRELRDFLSQASGRR